MFGQKEKDANSPFKTILKIKDVIEQNINIIDAGKYKVRAELDEMKIPRYNTETEYFVYLMNDYFSLMWNRRITVLTNLFLDIKDGRKRLLSVKEFHEIDTIPSEQYNKIKRRISEYKTGVVTTYKSDDKTVSKVRDLLEIINKVFTREEIYKYSEDLGSREEELLSIPDDKYIRDIYIEAYMKSKGETSSAGRVEAEKNVNEVIKNINSKYLKDNVLIEQLTKEVNTILNHYKKRISGWIK